MGYDFGAWRSAEVLSARLGVPVTRGGVEQLAASGLVALAGTFKGCQLYCAECLDLLVTAADVAAAEAAADATRLLNRYEAARRLGCRQSDFDLLVRVGLILPDELAPGNWHPVRLFAPAVLAAFAARPDIDWAAVRATPPGRRSPLYALCEPELVLLALGGPPPPRVRPAGGTTRQRI